MPARTTARRAGRFGAAALLASVALTMIVGVESSAEPISEPLNNGNAMIAGSACESGLQEVAATLPTDATVEGTFICAYDTITIETDARPDAPSTALLGNVFTGESRQVDITSPDQIESAQEAIGAIPETSAQRSDLPNTCLPRNGTKKAYRDGAHQAHGDVSLCYGRFISRNGVPVEPVWSDWLNYIVRQNLTNRYNQDLRVQKTSTSPRWVDVELAWDVRESATWLPDPYITSGSFDISAWVGGNETTQQYFVPQGANTYHATQTTTKVYDIATGDTFIAATTLRLPDFDCPASDEDGCSFS